MSSKFFARSEWLIGVIAGVALFAVPNAASAGGNSIRIGTGGINARGNFNFGNFRGNVGLQLGSTFVGRNTFFIGHPFVGGNSFFLGGIGFNSFGFGGCGLPVGGFGGGFGGVFAPGWFWGGCGPWGGWGNSIFFANTFGYGYPFGVGRFGYRPLYAGFNGVPCVPVQPLFYGVGSFGFGLLPDSGLPIYGRRFGLGGGLTPPTTTSDVPMVMPPTAPLTGADAAPAADVPVNPFAPEGLLLAAQPSSLGNRPMSAIAGARLPIAGFNSLGNRPVNAFNP